MTLTLEITPEIEALLQEKARRRGKTVEAYLRDLAERDDEIEQSLSVLYGALRNLIVRHDAVYSKTARVDAVRAIGSYDTRRAAGLPPLSDADYSRESIYGARGQ